MRGRRLLLTCAVLPAAAWGGSRPVQATDIWSAGPGDLNFSKPSNADSSLAINQDQITGEVWITRDLTMGLYNFLTESAYTHNLSPAQTQWAFSSLNGNPAFAYGAGAAQYPMLTFSPWETALGGMGSLLPNITTQPAVLHLIPDDIYIDIMFTDWGSMGDGSFAYTRAINPNPTATAATWNAMTGNWSDGTRWSTGVPPLNTSANAYSALINGGTVNLDTSPTLNSLTLANGTLSGAGDLTLLNSSSIDGNFNINGRITIASGTLVIGGGATQTSGPVDGATLRINAGTSLSSAALNINSLTLNGNAAIRPASGLSTIGTLTLAGAPGAYSGLLDLTNNSLIVGTGDVANQIKQAAALGAWNGTGGGGITSSSAAAAATTSTTTALAYASGAEYTAATGQTTFSGHSFNPTDTLIMYTLAGDANMDGSVTFADFLALQNNYNKPGDWAQGDWNYDGQVTFADFLILQNNYNKPLPAGPLLPSQASDFRLQTSDFSSSAPEPSTLLAALFGIALSGLRRPSPAIRALGIRI